MPDQAPQTDSISLCPHCNCMTKTVALVWCGKCHKRKVEDQTQAEGLEQIGNLSLGTDPEGKDYCLKDAKDVYHELSMLIDQYANQRALELLDELVQELPVSERMAWSDEDGSHMETKVFQTNMKAWIDAKRLNLTKEQP